MRQSLVSKSFVFIVIFLFIGVAVAPSINSNVVNAFNDNDLVEVTSQACGIQGFGNTTVKLTKQQYQDLEQYLVDFRAKLNQTTTREETVPIFNDAVVELNKYGLLPKGMSVEKAQKLISGPRLSLSQIEHLKGLLKKNRIGRLADIYNLFCFINAHTSVGTLNINLVTLVGVLIYLIAINPTGAQRDFLVLLSVYIVLYSQFKPFIPANIVVFLKNANYSSSGLLGTVKQGFSPNLYLYGFTGFEIWNNSEVNYLGWAVATKTHF